MQLRLGTDLSPEEYVARQAWRDASPPPCPFHPNGRCQLAGHGTYERQTPSGGFGARWGLSRVRGGDQSLQRPIEHNMVR